MGRKAGDSSHYEWRLWDKSSERSVKGESLELPSVTTIIGAILAKQLDNWVHAKTLELLAAGLGEVAKYDGMDVEEMLETLTDGDALKDWVKEQGLRPLDFVSQRGKEGHEHHDTFERLGIESVVNRQKAMARAKAHMNDGGVEGAMYTWWVNNDPEVLAPEQTIRWFSGRGPSPLGFAGTLDLAYVAQDGARTIVDLKTRGKDAGVWDSDRAQVGGLKLAYEQHKGIPVDRLEVFVAKDDGKFRAEEVDASTWTPTFLRLFEIYELTRR